jgi:hypothetical protein
MSEKELLDAIFKNTEKERIGEPIELTNQIELVITQRPISAEHQFKTEDEYEDYFYQLHQKAAQELFNQLLPHSCIAFWLELTKLVRKHCIERDDELRERKPGKHFEVMFDQAAKGEGE